VAVEKHGTRTRHSWRKRHIAMDAETGVLSDNQTFGNIFR
jgi:hypothetical protein